MKSIALVLALAATAPALADDASDFEYHGYMRSGLGFGRGGTDQACFQAAGASAKFRLGNECETYVETEFVKRTPVGKAKSAPSFNTHFRLAAVSGQKRDWEPTTATLDGTSINQEFTLALREAYVDANGVLGKARPWIGKRFYRRQDIHILDYYIIDNSGPGAGVEDIGLGFAKLHLALTRNVPFQSEGPAQTNIDARLSDIAAGGKLEVILIQGNAGKRGHASGVDAYEPLTGTQLGLVHTLDVLGGFNRLTLQYGTGLFGSDASRGTLLGAFGGWNTQTVAKGDDTTAKARKDSSSARVAEELVSEFGKSLSNSLVLVYQTANPGGLKDSATGKELEGKTELMAGVRPIWHLNDTAAVAFEAGTTQVKNATYDGAGKAIDATLNKLTLAPQLTAGGGFWARPTLRLFATYASWDDDSKGSVGGRAYAHETTGYSTGAQLEAWW